MNQDIVTERCGICEEFKEEGIHIYKLFICCECEKNIVHTEPKDEMYSDYVQKLKHMNQPTLYI